MNKSHISYKEKFTVQICVNGRDWSNIVSYKRKQKARRYVEKKYSNTKILWRIVSVVTEISLVAHCREKDTSKQQNGKKHE